MKLVIDIGNTRAKLVVFDKKHVVEQVYSDASTLIELDQLLARYSFEKSILSTVAEIGSEAESRLSNLPFPLVRLQYDTPLPMKLRWRKPGATEDLSFPPSMGADRIAALVGAMAIMPNTPLLVVDAGTCITYEFIEDGGTYLGGNIAPGIRMRFAAMHEHTALLPLVSSEGEVPVAGYDTDTAMRCGVVLGVKYEIEGYILHWKNIYPSLHVILTGGDHMIFSEELEKIITRDNYLVPKGLNAIIDAL